MNSRSGSILFPTSEPAFLPSREMLVAELRTDLWVYAAIFAYVALSSFVLMSFGLFRSQALFAYLDTSKNLA